MTVLAKPPNTLDIKMLHDFKPKRNVHHTIYFRQGETAKFISDCFKLV